MEVIIDRIEGNFAVCEVDIGDFINIPLTDCPDAKEGDTIDVNVEKYRK